MRIILAIAAVLLAGLGSVAARQTRGAPAVLLETLPWTEAERHLTADAIVLIPLGAASKEHGPHLPLRNDLTLAEYLVRRVGQVASVVVAPALTYHHYPAFLEYPGSTSLSLETARDLATDVVGSLARYGPRRFYVLNTGISTTRALEPAAQTMAAEGVLLHYTRFDTQLDRASRGVREQEGGSHADEIETSMMLYIDASTVDMPKAVKDFNPRSAPFSLTRRAGGTGTYSPTGIWGDPTLATREKGRLIVESLVAGILDDIEALREAALPQTVPRAAQPVPESRPAGEVAGRPTGPRELPERCSAGDERSIRAIGDAFTAHWANADAERLGLLWSVGGDIAHPDGVVERGSKIIIENRFELFSRKEYRGSRHPIQLGVIRCLANDIAVADGKWELRGVRDRSGQALPQMDGFCTLVVKRTGGRWQIEAYRYTMTPPKTPIPPTFLKRPGWPA